MTGTNGTALGQINSPINVGVSERGGYVADTGNNRIQRFDAPAAHNPFSIDLSTCRFSIPTNLNQPAAVAAVDNLTNEMFYVADTGNNRVILYALSADDPTPPWTNLTAQMVAGNITNAIPNFSVASFNMNLKRLIVFRLH